MTTSTARVGFTVASIVGCVLIGLGLDPSWRGGLAIVGGLMVVVSGSALRERRLLRLIAQAAEESNNPSEEVGVRRVLLKLYPRR